MVNKNCWHDRIDFDGNAMFKLTRTIIIIPYNYLLVPDYFDGGLYTF